MEIACLADYPGAFFRFALTRVSDSYNFFCVKNGKENVALKFFCVKNGKEIFALKFFCVKNGKEIFALTRVSLLNETELRNTV